MADLPPLPPRRSVTAGRPLPTKDAAGAAPIAAPAPIAASPRSIAAPAAPLNAPAPAARFAKPDPRPMRWAFGASAVAAVSILTVGFVKPDFATTDDQAVVNDSVAEQAAGATNRSSRARVNRVTRYVYLERGERAPRGATVIDADQAPGRRQQPRGDQPEDPRVATNTRPTNARPANARPANNQPQNNDRPAADPQPRPEQPPRTTTHQSGG